MADLAGADLYVTRINKVGHAMNAKPCGPCMELIKAVGFRRVFFTTNEGEVKCL